MGAVFNENLHAPVIIAIQVRRISFAAWCVMRGCDARAMNSIRPIDYIVRPATADLLVCSAHAKALTIRARGCGLHISV